MALFSLTLAGCADRLVPNPADAAANAPQGQTTSSLSELPADSGNFSHGQQGTAYFTVVDASDYDAIQFLDLDSGHADGADWDLGFRRFLILTNGGVSGNGGVEVARLPDVNFEALSQAPGSEGPWITDREDGQDDEDGDADTAFNDGIDDWYDYDVTNHSLSSKEYTYVVRSSEDRYYKLVLLSYYDDVGTSGVVGFRWAEIGPPPAALQDSKISDEAAIEGSDAPTDSDKPQDAVEPGETNEQQIPDVVLTVDASSYEDFVYLNVESGLVEISNPLTSDDWDLAIRRYVLLTNSGTSGPGAGGARLYDGPLSFENLSAIVPADFVVDEILEGNGAPGSSEGTGNAVLEAWYDYEGLGALSPKDAIYVLRTASGDYAKLRISSYVGGVFTLTLLPISAAIDP